ncbi:MAG: hypothetical protein WDO19_26615 [Bacteroidota bacterium]
MKYLLTTLIVLAVASGIFYFTKPSNRRCADAAMNVVNADSYKVPGYSDPNNVETKNATAFSPDNLTIDDKFLWKKVSYVYLSQVKTIGYGYLGSFHKARQVK